MKPESKRVTESVPLAIVGIGCLFPKADGPGAFWANVKQGVDCVGPVPSTHWKPEDYFDADPKSPDMTYAARGAFLDPVDFNPLEFGISPVDLEATDTSQLLGLVAARQALNDAGYTPDKQFDRSRVSVVLGVTGTLELVIPLGARLGHPKWRAALKNAGVDEATTDRVVQEIADSYVPWQENSFPGLLGNVVAGRIANKLDLGGTNCVVDAACASSLSAIHLASLELAAGRCDVAVSGGVDTFNDIFMFMCFSKTPALSKTGDARPFESSGDGTILGEGLGVVVLKRLADAERDGDRVYAVLKAIGTSSDGKGNAVYAPSASGQVRCLENAYKLADVSPATIELVEAHGTGTKVGDTVEATALAQVFRESGGTGTWCAVGSVKSMIGHTKAAAGAAGLIKAALALHNKVLPPTLKVKSPVEPLQPGKSPLYVNSDRRPWLPHPHHPRRAGLSAFGFGGSNFHAVLEEHRPVKAAPDWDGRVQIVALSATTDADLRRTLGEWKSITPWNELCRRAADSRAQFDPAATVRLLLVARHDGDWTKLVGEVEKNWPADLSFWSHPDGAFLGRGPKAGSLAVLFPGQGSQTVGMLRDLACTFPAMLEHLGVAGREISDAIYPPSAFTTDTRDEQESKLRSTDVAQPALGAVSFGAWNVLREFGIVADAFAGHSYGELVALAAAGSFDAAALQQLSRKRGELMASFKGDDAGTMLAVHADASTVETLIRERSLALTLANRNSPTQCVVSGSTAAIAQAEAAFRGKQVRTTRLPVAAAFHSPLIDRARGPFRESLEEATIRRPQLPVFGNRDGTPYPSSPHDVRDRLAAQLAEPVDFVAVIEKLAASGVRTFLEVGPGRVLGSLAAATLADKPGCDCSSVDASGGRKPGLFDLALTLARLAARGHAVDLVRWEHGQRYPVATAKPGLTVAISGANYVKPRPPSKPVVKVVLPTPKPQPSPVAQAARVEKVVMPPPNPPPQPPPASHGLTQQALLAFQKLQEDTARLHQQFLQNQQQALATFQAIVGQQQGQPVAPPPAVMPYVPLPPVMLPPAPVAPTPARAMPVAFTPVMPIAAAVPAPRPAPPPKREKAGVDSGAILLSVVAEKTGYPADMLGLDMALDADLGIDSIKRVEILSTLQERMPDAPAVKPEHLGTFHTLRDIVDFLGASVKPTDVKPAVSTAPPATAVPAPAASNVSATLLEVVAEKTGYPADMLGLDMALDADLGIDSIKRVEILSTLQERMPDAPAVKPEHLGTLHTLRDIATFLEAGSGPPPMPPPEPPRPFVPALTPDSVEGERQIPLTFPTPLVETKFLPEQPPLTASEFATARRARLAATRSVIRVVDIDHDAPRGRVSFDKHGPVWLVAEPSAFTARLSQQFDTAGCRPQFIPWNDSPYAYDATRLAGLVLIAPDEDVPADLPLRAFRWLKQAAKPLAESARNGGSFFVTVSKLDGKFGFGSMTEETDPVQGAFAGLAKTAAREWPGVACKAIDIEPAVVRHAAKVIVDEALTIGPVEVGLSSQGKHALDLVETPAVLPAGETSVVEPGDVFIVTGGARGVTAEALFPLVRQARPTLVLLGRTPVPDVEPEWLAPLQDEGSLKRAIASRLEPPALPRAIGEEYKRVIAAREARRNVLRLREAGATVEYRAVDVLDGAAVAATLADVRKRLGPIVGIVHGAGVLADRRIEDSTEEQFLSVYRTKVDGLNSILQATVDDPLKAIVLFSSSTGRFGRVGQVAYAAANEVLNKIAQRESRRRPHCRTVAVNWGPWDGGMVTPALAKVFSEEGIGLISLADGGETLWMELASADRPAETVVLGRALVADAVAPPPTPSADVRLVFERQVRLDDHPVLRSHVIGDKAVVPLVLHLEWMAHAAMHGQPGLKFHGVDDLRVFQGVHVAEGDATPLRVFAGKPTRRGSEYKVPVEIRGTRRGREALHSRGEIVLVDRLPEPTFAKAPPATGPFAHSIDEVYEYMLFHGPDLRALERIDGMGEQGAVGFASTAGSPAQWMDNPERGAWLSDPMALDAAFQLLIVWGYRKHRSGSLPCYIGKYRQHQRTFPAEGVMLSVHVTRESGSIARAAVDFIDSVGRTIASLADVEHVIDASLNESFRRGRMLTPVSSIVRTRR